MGQAYMHYVFGVFSFEHSTINLQPKQEKSSVGFSHAVFFLAIKQFLQKQELEEICQKLYKQAEYEF